jgi:hypothetical protein
MKDVILNALREMGGVTGSLTLTTGGTPGRPILPSTDICLVTSNHATNYVTLPTPIVGRSIIVAVGANGCDIESSDPATIGINGGTGAGVDLALPAHTIAFCKCSTLTEWTVVIITGTAVSFAAAN